MKQLRIKHFNEWPLAQEFKAEAEFKKRLQGFQLEELFFPYQLPDSPSKSLHICVSYFLDAIDSLPLRPDHAFDWVWRGFEYLSSSLPGGQGNITNGLRTIVCPTIEHYFLANQKTEAAFFEFTGNIPFQTCEYLLKRILDGSPYELLAGQSLSSYAKRILLSNGNPPVVSIQLQDALIYLSKTYIYSDTESRRNGAALLRKIIKMEQVTLDQKTIQLSKSDVLFFLISGLGYAFRNDRAHAKSIAPFRSSYASVKTYAHCWFLFLLFYKVTIILLHTTNSPITLSGEPDANLKDNNQGFIKLFGGHLSA